MRFEPSSGATANYLGFAPAANPNVAPLFQRERRVTETVPELL
jgi:hypothetical protein